MSQERPAKYGGEPIRDEVLGYGSQSITDHEKEAVLDALDGDYITRGPTVEEFEQRVADLVGVEHAVATTSGTTALHLTGRAAGFESGDERSEERRVGKECTLRCRSRWSPYH